MKWHAVLFDGALLINTTTSYIKVVCIQIVPHWGSNQECGINQGNMVIKE